MTTLIIEVDQRQAQAALKKLNASIDNSGKKAEKSFDKAGSGLDKFGGVIGITTASVAALSAAFVTLAAVATKAFIDITEEGVNLNKEAELTKLSLTAIFEGNEQAAQAFIDNIGELAIKLGTSRQELTGLAKGILPDVGSIKGTTDLLENVIVLGRDAGQGIESIRIATEEALSGNLTSLGRRLNIPRKTLDSIKEYQKEMSLADAINRGLSERILETGISADVTADSFVTLQGKISGTIENFKRLEGEAPFEELKEQARGFLEILDTQGENIGFVAEAFGELAANVIDFVGSGLQDFIGSIDFEAVEDMVDAFNRAFLAGQLVVDILFEFPDAQQGIERVTDSLKTATVTLEGLATQAKLASVSLQAAFNLAQLLFALKGGDLAGVLDAVSDLGALASTEKQEDLAKNAADAFSDYEASVRRLNDAQKERRDTSDDATQADIDAGEALLANKKALDELATAQKEAADAQEEITEKRTDLEEAQAERLTAFLKKQEAQRTKDNEKAAQQRENIALKNTQAIEQIFLDNKQAIEKSGSDLSDEEKEIATEGARTRKEIDLGAANERLDIERDFRQELASIQNQFNQEAADAERNNDAQAFLRAARSRNEQVDAAKISRDEELQGVDTTAGRQRAELKVELKNEVEDARTANSQKLEDFQLRLDQELEKQSLKNAQEIEQQGVKERQLEEQRAAAFERDFAALEQSEAKKLAKLNESLEKQFAILQVAKEKEVALVAKAEADKTKIVTEEMERRAKALARAEAEAEQTSLPPLAAGINRGLTAMAAGGDMVAGQSAVVGDAGPEIFTAPAAGRIIPNQTMFSPPGSPLGAGASVNNSRSLNVEALGINPGDGILSRMVQNEMSKMLELLG